MRKVGDSVTIKSKEWIDTQPKDSAGDIKMGDFYFITAMFQHAGQEAKITDINKWGDASYYEIDIDEDDFDWIDEMFEDDNA